jgi:hypothetical protein
MRTSGVTVSVSVSVSVPGLAFGRVLEVDARGPRGVKFGARAEQGCRAQSHRQSDHLVVIEEQRGKLFARVETVAAVGAHGGLDAITHLAQPVDVAPHRAVADAEAFGQEGARPVASSLQQREQREQSRGRGGHASILGRV